LNTTLLIVFPIHSCTGLFGLMGVLVEGSNGSSLESL
jgi:hypothetical protein